MEGVMQSMADWIKSTATDVFNKLLELARKSVDDGYKELLDVTNTCDFLGINYDTFSNHYRYMQGFPRELPGKRWSKRAIIKWLEQQI